MIQLLAPISGKSILAPMNSREIILDLNRHAQRWPTRGAIVLAMYLMASGCSLFSSSGDRFNEAFPPTAEVRVAAEALRSYLRGEGKRLALFEAQYREHLRLRAATCSLGLSIGSFDSADAIRRMSVQQPCLRSEDAKLLEFLGIKQVAARLIKPPLRPLAPIGTPVLVSGVNSPYSAFGATGANVAVIRNSMSEMVSVTLPGGEKLADLPKSSWSGPRIVLSPNGRVVVFPRRDDGTLFVDVETGEKLWAAPDLGDVLVFNPELQIALANPKNGNELQLIDFVNGTHAVSPVGLTQQAWGVNEYSKPSEFLVGSIQVVSAIEGEREASGVELHKVKTYALSASQGVTSNWPTLMNNGKTLLFVSMQDYALLDLETGEERLIESKELLGNQYAKYSESEVLVNSFALTGAGSQPWLLDVNKLTLAPVVSRGGKTGIVMPLGERTGFAVRDSQIWFGDQLELGDPVTLDSRLRARNLEKQLAKLSAMESGSGARAETAPAPVPAPAAFAPPQLESACSKWRERLPARYTVYAGGEYKGRELDFTIDDSNHRASSFQVTVHKPGENVVLLLGAYEPAIWSVQWSAPTHIVGVWVSGYYAPHISGLPAGTPLLKTGGSATSGQCPSFYLQRNDLSSVARAAQQVMGQPVQTAILADKGVVAIGHTEDTTRYIQVDPKAVESYRTPGTPMAGNAGIEELLRTGKLRAATRADYDAWRVTAGGRASQRPIMAVGNGDTLLKAYVVLAPMAIPADLYGGNSVMFIVSKGVQRPTGNPGHSSVLDMNDGREVGPMQSVRSSSN